MDIRTVRKIFLTGLVVALAACGPAEQGAEEDLAGSPAEIIPLEGTSWQLVQMTVLGGFVFTPDDPSKYVLNFRSENRLTGTSDCNQISGAWQQEDTALRFDPFISTRKLCPPGSLHNNLALYLKDAAVHEFRDDRMILTTTTEGIAIEFQAR